MGDRRSLSAAELSMLAYDGGAGETAGAMDISLNPFEVLKYALERGAKNKAQVASYIEAIARDVQEAAEVWCETVDELKGGKVVEGERRRRRLRYCYDVENHYLHASNVISGRLAEELRSRLFGALGGYLKTRGELEALREFMETCKGPSDIAAMQRLGETLLIYAAQLRSLGLEISKMG
jgi:hypothetical protein